MVSNEQQLRIRRAYTEPLKLVSKESLTAGVRGSQGQIYLVRLASDRSLSCTCPDFERNCRRLGMVCKHVSYFLLRVFGCVPRSLLQAGHLTREEYEEIERFHLSCCGCFGAERPSFEYNGPHLELDCPICLGHFREEEALVQCPSCRQILHRDCARHWFAKGKTACVLCRSEAWAFF